MLSLLTKLNSEMSELKAIQSTQDKKLTFEPDPTKKSESIPGQGSTDCQVWGMTDPNRSKILKSVDSCSRFLQTEACHEYEKTRRLPTQ